ncbi:MAG: SDR family oxidoreductase [Gemmataceae bacterium]|nr:SDR family oxidoreductase [Gemmataceae bacterium]
MPSSHLILGCGYLGRHVAALWRQQGRRVFAATRDAAHLPADVEPIVCDVLDPASLRALPKVDTVLYAIGFDRTSGATMRSVYVDGLANLLSALFSPLPSGGEGPGVRGRAPGRFIYVSSSSVYGQTDGGWVDEASPTEPAEPSGQIVLDAEAVLRAKLPSAIVLRFAGIYGPGRLLRRQTIEKGEPIVGDADKWLNLIHVEDGGLAVLAAEGHGQPGRIYNVCDDHPVRRRYFYAALAKALDAPAPHFSPLPSGGEGPGVRGLPPHERANRRINNRRMKEELGVELRYPDYGQGLRGSF